MNAVILVYQKRNENEAFTQKKVKRLKCTSATDLMYIVHTRRPSSCVLNVHRKI